MKDASAHDYFVIQTNSSDRETLRIVEAAFKIGRKVVLNSVPSPKIQKRLLRYISVAVLNQLQLSQITGIVIKDIEDAKIAVLRIYGRGADTVIVRMHNGTVLVFKEEIFTLTSLMDIHRWGCEF